MPSPSRGNHFMLFTVVFGIGVSLGLELLVTLFHLNMPLALLNTLFQFGSLFVPCAIYMRLTGQSARQIIPTKGLSFVNVALILLMSLCIQPLAMLLGSFYSLFFGSEVSEMVFKMYDQPFFIVVLATCVSPAIFEEMTLRGIVLSDYKNIGIKKAALINGLFFGILHLQAEQFLYAFLLGAIFACFVHYTKSIWASVLAHFFFNFTQTAQSYFWYHDSINKGMTHAEMLQPSPFEEQVAGMLVIAAAAVIFTLVFVILFNSFIAYNKYKNLTLQMNASFRQTDDEPFTSLLTETDAPKTKVFNWSFWVLMAVYVVVIVLIEISKRMVQP